MLKVPKLTLGKTSFQGFTMLEVLVAILITLAFVTAGMQLMVVNVLFKVKSERQAQAMFWIQQDKEQIRAIAAYQYDQGVPYIATLCNATTATTGYGDYLKRRIESPSTLSPTPTPTPSPTLTPIAVPSRPTLLNSKNYQLFRNTTAYYNTLQIGYEVNLPSTDPERIAQGADKTRIATSSDEVIPDAALNCPK